MVFQETFETKNFIIRHTKNGVHIMYFEVQLQLQDCIMVFEEKLNTENFTFKHKKKANKSGNNTV